MTKLTDVRMPLGTKKTRSRVLLNPQLANVFRTVCKHTKRDADSVFEEMLEWFIRERTQLKPVYNNES